MTTEESAAPTDREYAASQETTSRHPQDWGRAVAVVFERLAEQAAADGADIDAALLDADIALHITETADGARIDATWRTAVGGE
ncbi:MAG TPA: hypothetical protein VGO26_02635 [Amnibacterium sp.]|jgi:hypothetical protein|nr:hypothetical protein [Amnibacterium sp.]